VRWSELIGVAVQVQAVRFERSRFDDDGRFAVVDAVRLDNGESVTLVNGARRVVEELERMRDRMREPGWIEAPVAMVAYRTARGRTAHVLMPLDELVSFPDEAA
jgi:hypothetical protein